MSSVPFAVRFGLDATSNRIINVASPEEWDKPGGATDATPRDWILNRANWNALAGRVGDLPQSTTAAPLRDGTTYLIKYRFGGSQLSRLAVWDSTQTQTGGVSRIHVQVDPADVASVQAEAGLGSAYPGEVFTGGNGDCVFDITPNADGTVTAAITAAGTGYPFGLTYTGAGYGSIPKLTFEVTELNGISATGGWRFVDTESWVKATQSAADVDTDRAEGDYQATTEVDHKELKVFHNGAWVTLFSEDNIKAWIASLSLFEGTVKEVGGSAVGAVEFSALPDLAALTTAGNLAQVSHYWTFVGSPNTTVVAGTPEIGADLDGAILNPGDWIQISNRGTAAAPDLHWVTIGGDLLAKARADKLFGLAQWTDGSWEKGALVTNKGTIYRAKTAVIAGDTEPGAGAGKAQVDVVTIAAPGGTGEVYTIDVNGNPASYTSKAGDGIPEVRTGLIAAINAVNAIRLVVTPAAGAKPEELSLTATAAGTPFVATMSTTNLTSTTTQVNVPGTTNNWEKVELSGGVRWVQTDGDLPADAPPGEIYFVIASGLAGGTGRLTYWDGGAAKWQDLGGGASSGVPLALSGGSIVYPDPIYWDGTTGTKPNGKVVGDLLYVGKTNKVDRWDGAAWQPLIKVPDWGTAGNKDKFVIADANGDPTWSNKSFEAAVEESAIKVFPAINKPSNDPVDATSGSVGNFLWRSVKPGTQHVWRFRAKTKVEPVVYLNSSAADGTTKHLYIQGQLMAGAGVFQFGHDENQSKATYWYKGLDYGDDNNRAKANRTYVIKTLWYESTVNNEQYMDYEYWYRRHSDDMKSIIWGRVYLPDKSVGAVTGYAINCYSHDKIDEAFVY